jgi:hypothetical protein
MNINQVLSEMAQSHIDDKVAQEIIDKNYEKAAQIYLDNIEKTTANPTPKIKMTTNKLRVGNYAKSLKANKELMNKIKKEDWDEFDKAYLQILKKEGVDINPKRKTTKGKVQKTKEGEAEIKSSGQSQKVIKDRLESNLVKVRMEYEKLLEKTENEDKKAEIKEHIDGINTMIEVLRKTKEGAIFPQEDREKLKKKYDIIQKNIKEKIQKKEDKDEEDEDGDEGYNEKVALAAVNKIKTRLAGMKDYDDMEKVWKDWLDRKHEMDEKLMKRARPLRQEENTIEDKIKSLYELV